MSKTLKSFILVVAAVLALWFIFKSFNGNDNYNTATAFEREAVVKVYFSNSQMGSDEDCSLVFPLSRTIVNAETLGPGALDAMLDGTSPTEATEGYFSNMGGDTLLQKFEIVGGAAYIDFNENLDEEATDFCKVLAIKAQIETTLNQFPDIDSVIFSVNGKSEGILEP